MSIENIKVLVYIAPPLVIETIKEKDGKKIKVYSGLLYDIWSIIKKKLIEKRIIKGYKETFVGPTTNTTMKEAYDSIASGKYDIGIGYFSIVSSRNKTHFARPVYLNKFCLAYIPDKSNTRIFFDILLTKFIPPILIGISISAIISLLLYISPYKSGFDKLWGVFTAILFLNHGEFLKLEKSVFNNFVNFTILLVSIFFTAWLQANITTSMSRMKQKLGSNKITRKSVINKKILAPEGYSTNVIWERYGVKVVINKKGTSILDNYIKNKDKYFGFFDDLEILKLLKKTNKKLVISTENFGFDEITWPVTKNDNMIEVLFHINNEIVKLQGNDKIHTLCKKYFSKDFYLCQL